MTEQGLSFTFHSRYFKLGEIGPDTKQVWFVLYGQGQLALYFLRKFRSLEALGICVIAPEGLSHYYLDGFNGRVGATWMTKENRTTDITNYLEYLNKVYQHTISDAGYTGSVSVLGFSQGAATASRWVLDNKIMFNRLILWGGVFPPDMNFEAAQDILSKKETIIVYGKSDPFLTDERFAEMRNLTEPLRIVPKEISFDGAHDIDEPTLLSLV